MSMKDPKDMTPEELRENSSYDPTEEGKLLRMSKSSFVSYMSCPRKYWWEKVEMKDMRMTATVEMQRGNHVHSTLEAMYDNWEGQSTLAPLIPEGMEDVANENLVFLEECRIQKFGVENFKPCEYEEYRIVWDEENQVVLSGLIDAVLVMPDGSLCIYELKTGNWSSAKMTKTRKELAYYSRMLRLMGETRPISHFAYLAPDASNLKFIAEMCNWKDADGNWDEDRVLCSKAGWLESNSRKEVCMGKNGVGVLAIEKVNPRTLTSLNKTLTKCVEGIKNNSWEMKWSDYFCPAWCDFSMSCESEMNGLDLW
jgi:hypothetical protein